MTKTTKNDKHTMLEILFSWLIGAGLNGFKFDTAFSIFFTRDKSASFKGCELPWLIELHLLGGWWFGLPEDWKDKVTRLGQGVEPDEPVKASELALLRWSEGAVIKDIKFTNEVMTLIFENKITLSVSLECEDEYVFMVHELGVNEENANWSVTCDGENYYYRANTEQLNVAKKGLCFQEGTLVDTPNGKIKIEKLSAGDEVWAYDFEAGEKVKRQITAIHRGFTEYWIKIKTNNGDEVTATRFHKFWVESENRWIDAIDLESGMSFRLGGGEISLVKSVDISHLENFENTYNFEVEGEHNCFVGDTGILVHNGHPEILGTELANKSAHESAQIIQRAQASNARSAVGRSTGIERIDIPVGDATKPGNYPHAHGVDSRGKPWSLNIDGSVHDAEKSTGTASKKKRKMLLEKPDGDANELRNYTRRGALR